MHADALRHLEDEVGMARMARPRVVTKAKRPSFSEAVRWEDPSHEPFVGKTIARLATLAIEQVGQDATFFSPQPTCQAGCRLSSSRIEWK